MKKFIAILALAMALCLVCGAAMAAVTYDYSTAIYVTNPDGKLVVKFKSTAPTGTDEDGNPVYAFQEWKVYTLKSEYIELADLDTADEDVTYKVVKDATCTEDAVLALIPQNAGLYTSNSAYLGEAVALPSTVKPVSGYTFYAVSEEDVKVIDMATLKKENKAFYNNYKAEGHASVLDYKVVKEATCDEPGELIPVCPKCKMEFDKITTDVGGHKSLIELAANAAKWDLLKVAKPGTTDGTQKVTDADGNEWTYKVTAASTCVAKGTYKGYCYVCGKKDATFEMPKNKDAHEFGEWQTEKAATCLDKGMEYRLCKLCLNATIKEERETDPLGHDYVIEETKAATCTEKGEAKKVTCSRCKLTVTSDGTDYVIKNTTTADETTVKTELAALGINPIAGKLFETPINPKNHPKEFWAKVDVGNKVTDAEGNEFEAKDNNCVEDGLEVYKCTKCEKVANTVKLPKTGHKLVTVYWHQDPKTGNDIITDAPSCAVEDDGTKVYQEKLTLCVNEILKANDGKLDELYNDPATAIGRLLADCPFDWVEVVGPDHNWDAWVMRNAPSDSTPGYWIRECKDCGAHGEYSGYTAPTNATDPTQPTKNGLQLEEDGTVQLYVDGKPSTASGVYAYNGGRFAVVNGKVDTSINGAVVTSATECLFFANGQVQESYTGLAEYNGQWFVVKAGKVDTAFNGLFAHDGGTFVVAAGRVVKELNGLWLAPDGEWYLISNGQVYWADAEVEYDGATFTVKGGKVVA